MIKDKRYLKTEKAIRSEFFNLLKENNYKDITVEKLCENAMISKNTFYAHYSGKDALFETIIDEFSSAPFIYIKEHYDYKNINNPEFFDALVDYSFDVLEENFELACLLFKNDAYIDFSNRLIKQFRYFFIDLYEFNNGHKFENKYAIIMIDALSTAMVKIHKDCTFFRNEISIDKVRSEAKRALSYMVKQMVIKIQDP